MGGGGVSQFPTSVSKVAFLGTPAIAVPFLDALAESPIEVAVVVTGPDRQRGRGNKVSPSPVKATAQARGLPVCHEVSDILAYEPDVAVVVAFGQLIGAELLERVPFCNIHFSLLPRWRGAAPVEYAILSGDEQTGVCLMALEEGLDSGPVFGSVATDIAEDETAGELSGRLAQLGAGLLLDTLTGGFGLAQPQTGEPSWAPKLTSDDRKLVWSRPAEELARVVRIGRAWTTYDDRRLIVHRARQAGAGADELGAGADELGAGELRATKSAVLVGAGDHSALELLEVQPQGRKTMSAIQWGHGLQPGSPRQLDIG